MLRRHDDLVPQMVIECLALVPVEPKRRLAMENPVGWAFREHLSDEHIDRFEEVQRMWDALRSETPDERAARLRARAAHIKESAPFLKAQAAYVSARAAYRKERAAQMREQAPRVKERPSGVRVEAVPRGLWPSESLAMLERSPDYLRGLAALEKTLDSVSGVLGVQMLPVRRLAPQLATSIGRCAMHWKNRARAHEAGPTFGSEGGSTPAALPAEVRAWEVRRGETPPEPDPERRERPCPQEIPPRRRN